MPFTPGEMLEGVAIPALVAGTLFLLMRLLLPQPQRDRCAAVALATGFMTGFLLLGHGKWPPDVHWHWLPYLVAGTALAGAALARSINGGAASPGPVSESSGDSSRLVSGGRAVVGLLERALLFASLAMLCAPLLVPDWADQEPSRLTRIIGFLILVTTLATLLEPLTTRIASSGLAVVLMFCGIGVSVMMELAGIGSFAISSFPLSGSLFGIAAVAICLHKTRYTIAGITWAYALTSAGWLLIANVQSFSAVPLASYLLVSVSPLAMWILLIPPIGRLPWAARLAIGSAGLLPMAIGIAIAIPASAQSV